MNRKIVTVAVAVATALGLAACSSGGSESSSGGKNVTLTMWMIGGCQGCPEKPLVAGFEKANPNITVKLVEQPTDSYFAALQSAALTGTGPDIAEMYAGSYMDRFKRYMADAHKFVPAEIIKSAPSINYLSEDYDSTKKVYAVPTEDAFYVGFYNKKIFADNGITSPPKNWSELFADSATLAKANVLPVINGAAGGSAAVQPLFEWSYLASALPASDWSKLYDGSLPYNNPTFQKQLDNWASLYKKGYLNKDAFNNQKVQVQFTSGKAAMWLGGGSWSIPEFSKTMGSNLGVMIPPYSNGDQKSIVNMAGNGVAVMNYSKHESDAGKFQAYLMSDAGQAIIAKSGHAATRPGFKTSFAALDQLSALSAEASTVRYPMFDNLSQPGVTTALQSNLGQVMVDKMSATSALTAIDGAFNALPSSQKKLDIPLGP
jgi:ABC-type glycerol-3-phosphate transport system substrate-binding protein